MASIAHDRYYRFDEFTAILQAWAQAHPTLLAGRLTLPLATFSRNIQRAIIALTRR